MAMDFEAAIDPIVARFDRTDGPGLTVGILQGGEVRFRKGYGVADLATGLQNGPGVPMRIASLSKQFLCTVVTMLAEEGALSLDDDIRSHLPALPDYGARISLLDLMSNQSGIRDFLELRLLSGGSFAEPLSTEESFALVCSMPSLNFEPGSDFAYCNAGFKLLTLVVEQLEGRSLEDVLAARIYEPLGMTSTRLVRDFLAPIPGRAMPYVETAAGLSPGEWNVSLDGAGGVVSTVDDLMIWAKNLRSPTVGTAAMFARMTRPRSFQGEAGSIYGLGFSTLTYRGQATFGHHGQLPGVYAEIAVYPELDTTIALIANTSDLNPFVIGRRIADAILGDHLAPKLPDPKGPALDGFYRDIERDAVLEIASAPDGSVSATTVMMDAPLASHAPGRLSVMWPMSLLDIAPAADGALVGKAGARDIRLEKLDLEAVPASSAGLAGRFYQPELRSFWILEESPDGLRFRIEGPSGSSDFDLRRLAADLFQARKVEEPCGPYRPALRLIQQDGRRRLMVTTDRTFGLGADEILPGEDPRQLDVR